MTKIVNIYEAKTNLSKLVERAAAGEEIIIAKAGTPRARLIGLPATSKPRQPGGWESGIWIADDFDDPLPADTLSAFIGDAPDDDAV